MSNLKLQFIVEMIDRATGPVRKVNAALGGLVEPASRVRGALGSIAGSVQSIVRIAAAATAAVGSLFFAFKKTADVADNISDGAQSLGMTTEEYQKLGYAAQLSGSSQDEMAQALVFLNKNMGEARDGSTALQTAFARVGVSMQDLRTLNAGQVFEKMSDKFEAVGDAGNNAQRKIQLVTELTGRSGYRMIQMMNGGSRGIAELKNEAKRLGVVLSTDTIGAMTKFNDAWDTMRLVMFGAVANAFRPLAPVLKSIVDRLTAWVVANRELVATRLRDFVERVATALPGFLTGISRITEAITRFVEGAARVAELLGGWPNLLALVAGAMGAQMLLQVYALATAIGVLSAALWANPLTWLLATALALVAALPLLVLHFDKVVGKLRELNAAMPDWLMNPPEWAPWLVTKLLPDVGLSPGAEPSEDAGEGGKVPKARPKFGAGGKVPFREGMVDIGGKLVIEVQSDAPVKVNQLQKLNGSPLDFDVFLGRTMAN